jgi:hypothetical protein
MEVESSSYEISILRLRGQDNITALDPPPGFGTLFVVKGVASDEDDYNSSKSGLSAMSNRNSVNRYTLLWPQRSQPFARL